MLRLLSLVGVLCLFLVGLAQADEKRTIPPPAPKDAEAQKKYDASMQRKFDLLPAEEQQKIQSVRKVIRQEGLAKLSRENFEIVIERIPFFWNAALQSHLAKIAEGIKPNDGVDINEAIRILGHKPKNPDHFKAVFVLSLDAIEAPYALTIVKRIKDVGLAKLTDGEKEFVRKNSWFFDPAPDK